MMHRPFFSIITVCLNAGNDLQRTIDSVLMQNFQDFIIVVKDGFSKDGSFERIPNIERILKVQKKDCSIYDAMNQALENIDGEYVLFLNAGDFFYDNSILDTFYYEITNNNFPGLVYCDYKTTGLGECVQSPNKLTNFFLFRTMLCHQVCMIRRDYYSKIGGFNIKYKVDADYDFLLRLLISNKATYKHIQKLGIISTSFGYSYKNQVIAKNEVRMIRKTYYPKSFFFYLIILKLTLPSLRERIIYRNTSISKIYQRLVNIINR